MVARLTTLLVALAATTLVACGSCPDIQKNRDAFMSAQGTQSANKDPHMSIEIPRALITKALDGAMKKLPKVPFQLQGLGNVGKYAGDYAIDARSMTMKIDKDDAARFDIDFDIKSGGSTIFGMEMGAVAPVQFDAEKGEMVISLRADMFEKVKPRIQGDAVGKLTDAIMGKIPGPARALVGTSVVRAAAGKAIDLLTDQAYGLLRTQVLSKLGDLAKFRVKVPDVPLAGIALSSLGADGNLRLDLRTTLAATGLKLNNKSADIGGNGLRMQVSTTALASLGNWAMGKGKIPSTFSQEGKPQKDGKYLAGVDWNSGQRPLKVHMWSLQQAGMCVHARAGADPQVTLKNGQLNVGFQNAKVEEFEGPALVKMAVGMMDISESAFEFTKKISTNTELDIGGQKIKLGLKGAQLDGDVFRIDLGLGDG